MSAHFADHFSRGSPDYAAHRPDYPAALLDWLASVAPARGLALDAGCGTGQLSVPLADRFARVVATDASAAQIAAARPHPRVSYAVATADRSGLPDASADLVTAAQAAHWFDLPAFYAEARRVARPGAVVALVGYGVPRLAHAAADAVLRQLHDDTLAPWWPAERAHVVNGYADLPFPFAPVAAPAFEIARRWSAEALVGYVGTWSAVRSMADGATDPLPAFRRAVAAVVAPGDMLDIAWPVTLRAGRLA